VPKIVDHDQRRRELATAAWKVIIESGIDGATTREIAKESGYSSGVLSHYFERKDDILLEALRISHADITRRLGDVLEPLSGLAALRAFCYDEVPLHEQQARETHLEISFWSRALVNDDLRQVQRHESAHWRSVLLGLIVGAQDTGELSSEDPELIAEILAGLIDGLSVHVLLYPERYTEARLVAIIDAALARWPATPPAEVDEKGL
jgi:AcrR family transcriptional regulator